MPKRNLRQNRRITFGLERLVPLVPVAEAPGGVCWVSVTGRGIPRDSVPCAVCRVPCAGCEVCYLGLTHLALRLYHIKKSIQKSRGLARVEMMSRLRYPMPPSTWFGGPGVWWILATLLLISGCTGGIQVRERWPRGRISEGEGAALPLDGQPSERTALLLRRLNQFQTFSERPIFILDNLERRARAEPNRDLVFALAELSYLTGRKLEKASLQDAVNLYIRAVTYSYFYLFDPSVEPLPSTYDPRFRMACALYNQSLSQCLRLAQRDGGNLDENLRSAFSSAGVAVDIRRDGLTLRAQEIGRFRFASDFEVRGLENHYRTYGLGVPLIAIRAAPDGPGTGEKFYPKEQSFPITAFLRMTRGICSKDGCGATLELYDPLRVQTIELAGDQIPLESDLTTPLAYFLARAKYQDLELTGLLRGEQIQDRTGLYMLQPYEKGKIPVVLIHGLWSSPLAWMPMFNDLRGDPALRDKYQFWFFQYPTGNPVPYSAQLLRDALLEVRATVDPDGKDAAMGQMVLVGHSMGGLLAKMMVQQSEDQLWRLVSKVPLEQLDATPEEQHQLERVFFFDPQPFVKRVIFIATPHQGSRLSNRFIGRLASNLIRLPSTLMRARSELIERNPEAFTARFRRGLPTSVDNLSPDSPVIQTLATISIDKQVLHHSIIGNVWGGPPEQSTDGVVPYASAHLADANSEYLVPAGHACQTHALAINEVRRILVEHLAAVKSDRLVQHADLLEPTPAP